MKYGWLKNTVVMVCLIGLFVSSLLTAGAEALDLSGYTNAEIEALLEQVQNEIVARGIEKTATLEAGQYTGGADIPVGSYTLLCKTDESHHGIVWFADPKPSEESYYSYQIYQHVSFEEEQNYYITVKEGCVLSIPFTCQLRISAGVQFK